MAATDSTPDHPRVGVCVFIWRDGKIIIQKRLGAHGEGTWSIPGGKLDYGESWEDCAAREAHEEIGVEIKNVRYFATTNDIFETDHQHYISIWMEADWEANEPSIQEPDKLSEIRWVTLADMPEPLFEPCWTNIRKIKPELLAKS